MMEPHANTIHDALGGTNAILIAGTGISAAISGGAPTATWLGLLHSGMERVNLLGAPNDRWYDHTYENLKYAEATNDIQALIHVASSVKAELTRHGLQAYADWLEDSCGRLATPAPDVGKALANLSVPILTTNYDTLIERVAERESVTWDDGNGLQQVISGRSSAIGHLHGVWDKHASVVLGTTDYDRHGANTYVQALQQAILSAKQIVFVGFGAGLKDPNFASLMTWFSDTYPVAGVRHFRLCLADEEEALLVEHANIAITPVPYGTNHGDLVPFLERFARRDRSQALTPAGIVRDQTTEAREVFRNTLTSDIVILDAEDVTAEDSEQAIVPPVILPVPYAEYAKAKTSQDGKDSIDRLDPDDVASHEGVLVVVGDEGSGLTTAIRWIAWKASFRHGGIVPIYGDFVSFAKGKDPLGSAIRSQARLQGLNIGRKDPLPRHVVALDNLSPFVPAVSEKTIEAISSYDSPLVIVGCHMSVNDDIVDRLKQAGVEPTVVYLGRLERSDIDYLARVASPSQRDSIVETVMALLVRNRLPRTPLTASLLILILLRGESVRSSSSQTAVLDQYVSLLLGRGDPQEDARMSIDQPGREAILVNLAEHLIRSSTAGQSEAAVIDLFEGIFERFGWKESPSKLLRYFLDRRILRRSNNLIHFSQNIYLYLFAAKRAMISDDFRDLLLARPLYYSAVLTCYGGLHRSDAVLLERILSLWSERQVELAHETSSPFEAVPLNEASEPIEFVEEGTSQLDHVLIQDDESGTIDLFDVMDPNDARVPLFADESGIPSLVWLMRSLELSSVLIRDMDQVEDLALKKSVLLMTLQKWGECIAAITEDPQYQAMIPGLVEALESIDEDLGQNREEFIEDMRRTLPATIVLGSIDFLFATRTLLVLLESALESGELASTDETAVASAFLIFAIGESGWPMKLRQILSSIGNLWVVRNFFFYVCFNAYLTSSVRDSDRSELLELLIEILERSTKFSNNADRGRHISQWRSNFTGARASLKARAAIASRQTR